MPIYALDPVTDARWGRLVECDSRAAVFHSAAWLLALRQTYAYEPVAFTTSPPDSELRDGIVFCRVQSRLTGNRLVALPFSDHCDPLLESPDQLEAVLPFCQAEANREGCRYIELRPRTMAVTQPFEPANSYYLHELDLRAGPEDLFRALHRDCIQRKIQRAEREKLSFRAGSDPDLLQDFYRLHARSRRRLGLVPQPCAWFRNLMLQMRDHARISVALYEGQPIASIFTLSFKRITTFKYGAADEKFNRLGGGIALMWRAILHACEAGHTTFDMGRSDLEQPGLVTFKDRWGANRSTLNYYRWPFQDGLQPSRWTLQLAKMCFSAMPLNVAQFSGRLIYRHIG